MSGAIEIPFAIGETVWSIGSGHREETVVCPECAGTKAITMIQGSGERFSLGCARCGPVYEDPRGYITRTIYEHRPERFVCARVSVDGAEVRYSEAPSSATCYTSRDSADLFRDQAECQARCDVLNAEKAAADREREIANIASKRKDLAWSVHYWQGQIRRLEKQLEAARAALAVCKEPKEEAEG